MSAKLIVDRQCGVSKRLKGRLRCSLAGVVLTTLLLATPGTLAGAAQCPAARDTRLPQAPEKIPVNNIDSHKKQLTDYHDKGNYDEDLRLVFGDARAFVEQSVDQAKRLAVVLDIDETSLSNWPNIKANDFGFIQGGPCLEAPKLACGFDEWILKASAPPIPPALEFFKAAIKKNVSVFFITGRRDSQRQATLWNLDRAGFEGWAGLRTRPDSDHEKSIVPFKSGERKKIVEAGYAIIATIGDQQSDLSGGSADCGIKLPNPFYFIE